ncbi:hypothetical protein SARC_07988 [Sphaeroforma arctica JP610]|uniref:GST N-terminal domain-containing protein n=1 Tax=Sphaeroforma arctica JP610 TaxID=667725 RepID=A0A0L0FSE7_9EUKA|nr:hypothetical protein SARC_07988 [Sphaeroforma arctica JP610]KNC79624.1 hypothetical protein SARC_07988 [Sphaeroforma arctica JP610]|eukprot:XP_014153526.1 hypothetical protein SARC_07988 [Sphaeroforma arctica JP610]
MMPDFVREHLCILDLDAEIRPCPRTTFKLHGAVEASSRFRGEAKERGGKAMFPFLIDENTGKDMYQSDAIVDYLWATYGTKKQVPFMVKVADSRLWRMPSLFLVSLLRSVPHMGLMASPSRRPEQPLELWGFEPSPPCKLVRETLCELELPYVQRNCAKGSIKRPEFREKYGHTLSSFRQITNQIKVPLLIDPNTKTELFESADIVSYLRRTYQVGESTDADLSAYSTAKKAY